MEEETGHGMNLDLNLGPVDHPGESFPQGGITLEELFARQRSQLWPESSHGLLVDSRVREGVTPRGQCSDIQRWLSMQRDPIPTLPETLPLSLELIPGLPEKGKGEEDEALSFFDCNICLDLASDPVVTCCGHLYCWPCLYRWLNLPSSARECPVCKGEVTTKTVTPIYGRGGGSSSSSSSPLEAEGSLKIPQRPQATRHESWRQTIQRSAFSTVPVEEMVRRLGSRFDVAEGSPERRSTLLARILTSRGMRRELGNTAEPYLRSDPFERNNQEVYPSLEDLDSVSTIAAMIHSEGQTSDTAVETDSSWRSGDWPPLRRRRLH